MVNTQTSISKKVLAIVLAVACMVCFTPSIAFTQDAHAASGGTISSSMTTTQIEAVTGGTATVSGKTITVTYTAATSLTAPITVAAGDTLAFQLNGYTVTADAGAVILGAGSSVDVEGTNGGTITDSGDVAVIDGTGMTTGTITVGTGITIANTNASTTLGAIKTAGTNTLAEKATKGSVVVNGTVSSTHGIGAVLNAGTATTYNLVALSGTGTISSITPATLGVVASTLSIVGNATVNGTLVATATGTDATEGAYTYTWYRSTDNIFDSKDTSLGTGETYKVATADSGSYILCIMTQAGKFGIKTAATGSAIDKAATVTSPADAAYSVGDTVSDLAAVASVNQTKAQWYAGTTSGSLTAMDGTTYASAKSLASNTTSTLTGADIAKYINGGTAATTALKTGTYYFQCQYTDSTAAVSKSKEIKVTVASAGDITFTTQPTSATVAIGAAAAPELSVVIKEAGTSPTPTYKWYVSKDGTTYTAATGTSATAATLAAADVYANISTAKAATYSFKCTVTRNGSTKDSAVATITVAANAIKTQPSNATYAVSDTVANMTVAMISGKDLSTSGVVWAAGTSEDSLTTMNSSDYSSAVTGTLTGADIAKYINGGTAATIATKTGTWYFQATVTDLNSTGSASTTYKTNVVKVTVKDFAITAQPAGATYAVGATAKPLSVDYVGVGTVQWYSNTTDSTTLGTKIDGATKATYTPDTTTAGTTYYYAVITYGTPAMTATTSTAKVVVAKAVTSVTTGNVKYTLSGTTAKAAKITKTSAKSITIAKTVSANGKTYKVTGIASKVFAKSKATTVTVKSTTLTKAGVKNCFKSSKVKTVKVPASKKSAYKKIFTKSNCGKTVTVK